jgi:hypothetical protein
MATLALVSATYELPAVTHRRVRPLAFTRLHQAAARSSPGKKHKPQGVPAHNREATRTALTGARNWATAEAPAICWVLRVEQATAWPCIRTLWTTTPVESVSATVASSR